MFVMISAVKDQILMESGALAHRRQEHTSLIILEVSRMLAAARWVKVENIRYMQCRNDIHNT